MPSNNTSTTGKILSWHTSQCGPLELEKLLLNNKWTKFIAGFEAISKKSERRLKKRE